MAVSISYEPLSGLFLDNDSTVRGPDHSSSRISQPGAKSTRPKMGKLPSIPGFTAVSDQVLVRERDETAAATAPADHPTTVLIYGWGDGLPKHVAKYAEGFRVLFPAAKQVVILSPISKALFSDLEGRTGPMKAVLDAAFPIPPSSSPSEKTEAEKTQGRVLIHTMSNTGAINFAATLNAYRKLYDQPMPHNLLVMDSTPGSTHLSVDNLSRFSRAMALGTAGWFPWPFGVTQGIWAVALGINGCVEWASGRESAGAWSRKAANDTDYELKSARKLYMYSKEDDLIGWEDVESHVVETRELGWQADTKVFEGSNHVGHMRKEPELYWKTINESWEKAVADADKAERDQELAATS